MQLIEKIFQYLGINNKLNRYLTLGCSNGFLLFLYKILDKKLFLGFITVNNYSYSLKSIEILLILVFSTVCFSKFYKMKGIVFQEKLIVKYGILPFLFCILIRMELFFTQNCKKGLFYAFFFEFCLFILFFSTLNQYFFYTLFILFLKYLFGIYIFFRILFNINDLHKYQHMEEHFSNYIRIYNVIQGNEITLSRGTILIFLFLTMSVFYKYQAFIA